MWLYRVWEFGAQHESYEKEGHVRHQGDNEEGKWKKHWVRTCDLHNLLAEEIDIPGASISKPRECTAKVVGIPAEVCL